MYVIGCAVVVGILLVASIVYMCFFRKKREHYGPLKFTFRPPRTECNRICERYAWKLYIDGRDMDQVLRLRDCCMEECKMMQRN